MPPFGDEVFSMSADDQMLVFSTPSYAYMRDAMCAHSERLVPGSVEDRRFPDGELYQRIEDDVSGRDVVLVGGTISDSDTLRIYDLSCALVKYGARSLTLAIPYFGYSTMERAVRAGEVVTAKTRARLFSAIPSAHRGNRVFLVDLHAQGLPHYFEGAIRATHLYAKPVTMQAIVDLGGADFCLASPDSGRAKWVESLAHDLGVPTAFLLKRRVSGSQTVVTAINADVRGLSVVIYDDMIRSGGTLIRAAEAYRDAGAASVAAVLTHGLFTGDALERLQGSSAISAVACTDSHPRAQKLGEGQHGILRVYPIGHLVAQACLHGAWPAA